MKNKVLKAISNPLTFIYDLKFTERIIRFCTKKKFMVFIFSLIITLIAIVAKYYSNFSELVKK